MWPDEAETELNQFLASHAIQMVDRSFYSDSGDAGWCLCVAYDENPVQTGARRKRSAVDYREVLPPADFDVFSELRNLRKSLAQQQGIPVYTVFSNEQLASMVVQRIRTQKDLLSIEGIGQSRCQQYGEVFLQALKTLQQGKGAEAEPEEPAGRS